MRRAFSTRTMPWRTTLAYPENSCPSVIGTASCRCVRAAVTTAANSPALFCERGGKLGAAPVRRAPPPRPGRQRGWRSGRRRCCSGPCSRDRSGARAVARVPPRSSSARFAITSLAFMLVEVPEPVWKTSTTKSPSNLPSATSIAACSMARPIGASMSCELDVDAGRGRLEEAEGAQEAAREAQPGDREVVDRTGRRGAVVGAGGYPHLPHGVALNAIVGHRCLQGSTTHIQSAT